MKLGALGALASLTAGGQDIDLTTVQTDYPRLKAGLKALTIAESKIEQKDGKDKWVIGFITDNDDISTQEKPIKAGHKLTENIGLSVVGKRTSDMILADCVRVFEAIWGDAGRQIKMSEFDIESVIGAKVTAKVAVEPEKTVEETGQTYPERNSLRLVKKAS